MAAAAHPINGCSAPIPFQLLKQCIRWGKVLPQSLNGAKGNGAKGSALLQQ